MGRGTMGEVRHGLGDPPKGKDLVRGHSRRSGTGWETLREVWGWSEVPPGRPRRVGGPAGRSGTCRLISRRSGKGWGTLR